MHYVFSRDDNYQESNTYASIGDIPFEDFIYPLFVVTSQENTELHKVFGAFGTWVKVHQSDIEELDKVPEKVLSQFNVLRILTDNV